VAHAGVVDLDSDLVRLGRSDFDVFNGKLLARLPGYGSLAGNGLFLDSVVNVSASHQSGRVRDGDGGAYGGVVFAVLAWSNAPFQQYQPF
jgi:DNA-directed RNA polymerase subunit E'/Rpb7